MRTSQVSEIGVESIRPLTEIRAIQFIATDLNQKETSQGSRGRWSSLVPSLVGFTVKYQQIFLSMSKDR